jgi:EAL domain-containing protein (putative c-di-GMP-specific phosphodiesterase class I)
VLIRDADTAMYWAKEAGRNRYVFFDDSTRAIAERRLRLEQDLRAAVHTGELEFFYQPQFSLCDGSLVGVEALLRWHHPREGLLLPDDFIPLAEESGLIEALGAWGVREGCHQAAEWATSHRASPQIVINVAVRHLTAPGFVEHLESCLRAGGLGAGAVCIEITESLPIPDFEMATHRLEEVRALGVEISLDDFGTGYSSLVHFRTLPIDWVKIDRSFVGALDHDATVRAVIESVIRIAETRGIKTVAEGVERAEQLDALRSLGCGYAQGYHFARPMRAADLEDTFLR